MTVEIVNVLCFRRSGVGPSLYTFHCCWLLAALSSDLATCTMQWMTQSATRQYIWLLAGHQKGVAKCMMQWTARYWNNQLVALQFFPGICIIHTCVAHVKEPSFVFQSLYKCLKHSIQLFLGGEVTFCFTEVCHNSDNEKNPPCLFWLPDWVPGHRLGQYICGNTWGANFPSWLGCKRLWTPFALPLV